jgi:hypothetical protein
MEDFFLSADTYSLTKKGASNLTSLEQLKLKSPLTSH